MASPVQSMTGFAAVEGEVAGSRLKIEIKAVNHRFLDLKIRLPRDLSSAEIPLRAALAAKFGRGAIDVKIERVTDAMQAPSTPITANLTAAAHYYEALITIQRTLGLSDAIRTVDLASYPEVLTRGAATELSAEEAWPKLEPLVKHALDKLADMRAHEGATLTKALLDAVVELEGKIGFLRNRRSIHAEALKAKTQERIRAVFEAYPIAETSASTMLESRVAQELALLLDRTDIEEELTRFKGHLDHVRKTLEDGGAVGRKIDFILQELNREINTLGNKAQDLAASQEVVQMKVRLEQLREQVMNLA